MTKKLLTIVVLLLALHTAQGQKSNDCYEYLTLKAFLQSKLENDTNFVRQVYRNVTYPKLAKAHEMEGKIEVMVISHADKSMEVVVLNHPLVFGGVEAQIHKAFSDMGIRQGHPFITRFYITFNLDALPYPNEIYQQFHLGLHNDDTVSILAYRIPLMNRS